MPAPGAPPIGIEPHGPPLPDGTTPTGPNVIYTDEPGPYMSAPGSTVVGPSFFRQYPPLDSPFYGPAYYTRLSPPLNYVQPLQGGWFQLSDGRLVRQEEVERLYWEQLRKREKEEQQRDAMPRLFDSPGLGNVRVSGDPKCRSQTICFDKVESSDPEIPYKFDEQLKMQQDALNAKTPDAVVKSIPADGTVDALRTQARRAQDAARTDYMRRRQVAFTSKYGKYLWLSHLSRLNAIHRLDMVAGGDPKDIVGMGDAEANQGIGREWPADSRRGALRRYAAEMAAAKCPMNVKLSVC